MVNDKSSVPQEQFNSENEPVKNNENNTADENNKNIESSSSEDSVGKDSNEIDSGTENTESEETTSNDRDERSEVVKSDDQEDGTANQQVSEEDVVSDENGLAGSETGMDEVKKEPSDDEDAESPEKDEDIVSEDNETGEEKDVNKQEEIILQSDNEGGQPAKEDTKNEKGEIVEEDKSIQDNIEEKVKSEEEEKEEEKVDYNSLDKEGLVNELDKLILTKPVDQVSNDVDIIKVLFYKIHKAEIETTKEHFLSEGGNPEDFKPTPDPSETKLRELLEKYKDLKSDFNRKLEEEKVENLEAKNKVIEDIKDLVNRKESINKTFQEFRELQQKWRDIGLVPQQNVKGLWESYHLACEMFYDYININKELRDLDLKKNLEAKLILCEKAEKLLLEPSVVQAFRVLQAFHDQWREIGPVPHDKKAEIWERFKEITSKINKRHHQYFEELKTNQKQNLEEKTALCEKVEELNTQRLESAREWEDKSKQIIEIQKVWKTIGFAPKKDNNKVYARFREACDIFFNAKREFFAANKEVQKNNLQQKIDLCVQAEALQESTDWKNTTESLIQLQKKWKKIGPVPRKSSDQVWERFRSACDKFFDRKNEYFSNIDSTHDDNLKKKLELIEEIEKYELLKDVEQNFNNINEFQKRWTDIGFVPIKDKDEVQNRYRIAINNLFDKLKVDDSERNILKYNNKLTEISAKPNASQKLRQEREKLFKKLTSLENDIVVWENNIGFFANSKNADSLIKDVKSKIENGKKSIELLKEKIRTIDEFKNENDID